MTLAAVLLAGGESRRMGRDKATLLWRNRPLWQVQLEKLRQLAPDELFISARSDPAWRPPEIPFVPDAPSARGPLGGLAAVFRRMQSDHLLALAIDLPAMTVEHLRTLRAAAVEGVGVVPWMNDLAESCAAIYPREAADEFIVLSEKAPERSMQPLIARLIDAGRLRKIQVAPHERALYRNVNTPADLE